VKDGLRVVAVVPARGGTDRIPYLNIKRLGDRPLLAHTLDAARAASSVDRVIVSTDDDAVAEVAKGCGAEAPFVRPRELAEEVNSLMRVVQHALREIERQGDRPDVVVLLQATTPFRDARAIDAAVARLVEGGFDSVVSVTEDRTLAWKDEHGLLVPLFAEAGPREKQPPIFKENGAVVALRRAAVDAKARFGSRVGYLVLDKRSGFTVYDLEDFWMAERLLRQPRILFRADGGRRIGMGHVYRSLAIADALVQASQAEAAFLMSGEHAEGIAAVSRAGYPVRVASDTRLETQLQHIRDFAPAILINDLQTLDDAYLRALSHLGCTTVNLVDTLDDLEVTEHYKQVIVSVMNAERETPEGFYGGPEFAILRSHFQGRPKELRQQPRLLLLSFGGSDPQGLTLLALRATRDLPASVEVVAVTGPAFADQKRLEALVAGLPRAPRLVHAAPGGHIADLMQEADVVVCSGGMSVYEIAALGTPGIVLGQNAREDERMRGFATKGTLQYLGLGTEVSEAALRQAILGLLEDAPRRRAMSERGRALVDGMGAARTAELVLDEERRREAALSGEGR
jgi:spore coat polysaccharide biosynthesis predicted glycosyltransferase SpsG/CMP-N-acetylneuraminic acid synthetase